MSRLPRVSAAVRDLPLAVTAAGKQRRPLSVNAYVHHGEAKLTVPAFGKTTTDRGQTRNPLWSQVCGFRLGERSPYGLDLLACFCQAWAIGLGRR